VNTARRHNRLAPAHRAFSLLELLVVIAITSLMFTALMTFAHVSLGTIGVLQDQNSAGMTARVALARLTREAMLATVITAAEEYHLAFTCTDITGDGAADQVEYAWDPDSRVLTRTLNSESETFADAVDLFRLEYQYETENEVTLAAPGDVLHMALARFNGVPIGGDYDEGDVTDEDIDVCYDTWYVEQTFENKIEAAAATSVTVRARAEHLPPSVDMLVILREGDTTVAQGWLSREHLATTFQDITIPLTWTAGAGTKMELGKVYQLRFRPGGSYPYWHHAGTLLYQEILNGPGLGDGLTLSYWDGSGHHRTLGDTASLYLTVRGNVTITTPSRSTVPVSVLKKIEATIRTSEGGERVELSRTCKVVNQ